MITTSELGTLNLLTAQVDGPVHACLMFGVGYRDEALHNHGVTHLVEHLTLSGLGNQSYTYNGSVSPTHTRFIAMGSADEIGSFLEHVCTTLVALPFGRLADEVSVLKVEHSRRHADQMGADLAARFGAQGPGLGIWPEFALETAGADEVRQWAERWFVRSNAVLWLSRPIPATAQMTLPDGPTPAHAVIPDDLISGRVWNPAATELVSLSFVRDGGWNAAATFGLGAIHDRATSALREKSAVSYSVQANQLPIGDGKSLCQITADGSAASYLEVLRVLTSTVDDVAAHGPTDEELSRGKARYRTMSTAPQAEFALLDASATRVIDGKPILQVEDYIAAAERVSPADVSALFLPSLGSLLATGPQSLGNALPEWQSRQMWSSEPAVGESFTAVPGREQGSLVIGATGVAWYLHQSQWRLIRWEDCAACVAWDTGARHVISADGRSVFVHPWAWTEGDRLPALVDAHAPQRVRVTGDPARAPKPPDPGPANRAAQAAAARKAAVRKLTRRFVLVCVLVILFGILLSLSTWSFSPLILSLGYVGYWLLRYRNRLRRTLHPAIPKT
jgi:hypothetical protein